MALFLAYLAASVEAVLVLSYLSLALRRDKLIGNVLQAFVHINLPWVRWSCPGRRVSINEDCQEMVFPASCSFAQDVLCPFDSTSSLNIRHCVVGAGHFAGKLPFSFKVFEMLRHNMRAFVRDQT